MLQRRQLLSLTWMKFVFAYLQEKAIPLIKTNEFRSAVVLFSSPEVTAAVRAGRSFHHRTECIQSSACIGRPFVAYHYVNGIRCGELRHLPFVVVRFFKNTFKPVQTRAFGDFVFYFSYFLTFKIKLTFQLCVGFVRHRPYFSSENFPEERPGHFHRSSVELSRLTRLGQSFFTIC